MAIFHNFEIQIKFVRHHVQSAEMVYFLTNFGISQIAPKAFSLKKYTSLGKMFSIEFYLIFFGISQIAPSAFNLKKYAKNMFPVES